MGGVSGSLEYKQMALVLLSALAIWSLLKLMTSSPVPAHQPTVAQDTTCACSSDFFFPLSLSRACVSFGRNVFKSGPVKTSLLSLSLTTHSE